jgi:membrane dipeptidase
MKCQSAIACAIALVTAQAKIALAADAPSNVKLLEKAKQIHARIVAFDSHLDLPFDYTGASADGKSQFDLPKVTRGQLKGAAIAVFVPQGPRTPEGYAKARVDADKKYQLIKAIADDDPEPPRVYRRLVDLSYATNAGRSSEA